MSSSNGRKQPWPLLKDGFGIASKIVDTLKRSFLPLVLTSVFYHIIAFTILTPLFSGYAGLFFTASGRLVVANEEIAEFFLQPAGFLAMLVIAACSLTLIALEQACLMALLVQEDSKGTIGRTVRAFKYTFKRAIGIHKLALRIVFRIILISVPFACLAWLLYYLLLSEKDINYYLMARPIEFKLAISGAAILAGGLTVTLLRYAVRVVFSLPILLFDSKHPTEALHQSASKAEGRKLSIALGIGAWGLIILVVSSLSTTAFFWAGRLATPFLIGNNTYLVPIIGLLFLGFTFCQFLISIAATASFSTLVMVFYNGHVSHRNGLSSHRAADTMAKSPNNLPVSVRMAVIGVVVSFIIAVITGWLLLSRADIEDRAEVVAHRGASGSAPENTQSAIEQAIVDGAHWVEIDVQRTADDRVVVVHDRDLVRVGNSPLVVSRTPYAQLAQIDVGSWFDPRFSDQRVPPLETVLEHCKGKIKVNIELKYYAWDPHLAGRVIAIVEKAHMENEIVVMSLKPEAVAQVKRDRPDWQVGLLAAAALTDLTRVEADFLAVHSGMVTPGFVRRVHRSGKTIQVWTVNDAVGMTKMVGMGVDALITDEPGKAARLLAQRAGMDPVERLLVTAGLLVVGDQAHVDPSTDGV